MYAAKDGPGSDTLAEVEPVQSVVVYLTELSGDGLWTQPLSLTGRRIMEPKCACGSLVESQTYR